MKIRERFRNWIDRAIVKLEKVEKRLIFVEEKLKEYKEEEEE